MLFILFLLRMQSLFQYVFQLGIINDVQDCYNLLEILNLIFCLTFIISSTILLLMIMILWDFGGMQVLLLSFFVRKTLSKNMSVDLEEELSKMPETQVSHGEIWLSCL